MQRIVFLIIFLFTLIIYTNGQSISRDVIGSSGDNFSANNVSLSWTLGECIIETFISSGTTLTQGFHQPNLSISSIEDDYISKMNISVYPNPVTDIITLECENCNGLLHARILDLNGRELENKKITGSFNNLSFSDMKAGIYILKITDEITNTDKIFRIIKQ